MKMTKKTRNDIILFSVILILAAACLLLFNMNKQEGSSVIVKIDGQEKYVYSLNESLTADIITGEDDEFVNTLVIQDGKAYISQANCPDKICAGHRAIAYAGETIVCLPHKVIIEISAEKSSVELDAVV